MMTARLAQKPGEFRRRRGEATFARRRGRFGLLGVSVTQHLAYWRRSSSDVGPQSPVFTGDAPGATLRTADRSVRFETAYPPSPPTLPTATVARTCPRPSTS